MMRKIVNILGTEYEIIIDAPDEMLPEDADGAMDHSVKRIVVAKFESDRDSVKDLDVYRKKVLRHEIIHAFYLSQDYGTIAVMLRRGGSRKKLQIGLQFNPQK